jgi:hypothetical protein
MASQPAVNPASPIDVLNTNPFSVSSLTYPLDLESSVGHYVNFFINVNRASQFYQSSGAFSYGQPNSAQYNIVPDVATGGNGGNVIFGTTGNGSGTSIGNLTNQRIAQTISLYIPDSMGYGQNIKWENASLYELGAALLDAGGALKSGVDWISKSLNLNALRTTAGQTNGGFGSLAGLPEGLATIAGAANQAMGPLGWAFNPQLLVLFRGIDFRSFQYDFFFTPRSQAEAAAVRNIIQAFRFHSHPELNTAGGIFYGAPATFDIQFMHKGAINTKIQQVATCVLVGYDVDYAPYGWSTYTDGMPVQTRLTLRFQETEILDKTKILQGY